MSTRYLANGLALTSSFELPGMLPAEDPDLPALRLQRVTQAELRAAWGGPDGPALWRGRLGDGLDLTIQPGARGDVLFSYAQRAMFLLDRGQQTLSCASRAEGLAWQRILLTKILPSVSVMRGYEALHASAVDSPDGVIAILAPSGAGKTTLALELMRRGLTLVSDDVLTLGASSGGVLAYPGTPHMNLAGDHPGHSAHSVGSTLGVLAGERWLAATASRARPRPVRMVCLLERSAALSLDAHRLPASPMALAPYMLGLHDDHARERQRFDLYADLASSAAIFRITSRSEDDAEDLAELIERELDGATRREAVGGRA